MFLKKYDTRIPRFITQRQGYLMAKNTDRH